MPAVIASLVIVIAGLVLVQLIAVVWQIFYHSRQLYLSRKLRRTRI
jgi:membrane-associated phospholipid phosphatase